MVHHKIFDVILYGMLTGVSKKDSENWGKSEGILPTAGSILTELNNLWGSRHNIKWKISVGRNEWEIRTNEIKAIIGGGNYSDFCKNLHHYIESVKENGDNYTVYLNEDFVLYLFIRVHIPLIERPSYIFIGRQGTGKTTLAKRFCEFCNAMDVQTKRNLCGRDWNNLPATMGVTTWKFTARAGGRDINIVIEDTMGYTTEQHANQQINKAISQLRNAIRSLPRDIIVIFVWAIDENGNLNQEVLRHTVSAGITALENIIQGGEVTIYNNTVFFILNKGDLMQNKGVVDKYENTIKDLLNNTHFTPTFIWWNGIPFALNPPNDKRTPKDYVENVFLQRFLILDPWLVVPIISQGFTNLINWLQNNVVEDIGRKRIQTLEKVLRERVGADEKKIERVLEYAKSSKDLFEDQNELFRFLKGIFPKMDDEAVDFVVREVFKADTLSDALTKAENLWGDVFTKFSRPGQGSVSGRETLYAMFLLVHYILWKLHNIPTDQFPTGRETIEDLVNAIESNDVNTLITLINYLDKRADIENNINDVEKQILNDISKDQEVERITELVSLILMLFAKGIKNISKKLPP